MFDWSVASEVPRSVLCLVQLSQSRALPGLAYLDPGTGSLLIQALIAGLVSLPFILRRRLRAVLGRLSRRPGRDPHDPRHPE